MLIAKPLPNKNDHKYLFEKRFMEIARATAKLETVLNKPITPEPLSMFEEDLAAVQEWNKLHANVFPNWLTREERRAATK